MALALAAALLSAGCGGGSDSPPPTKAAYLKQVNKICEEGQKRHDSVLASFAKQFQREGLTPKMEGDITFAILDPLEETTERIAQLTPPKGGEPKAEALIKAREDAAARMSKDPLITYEGHPYREVEKFAKSAGVNACLD